MGSSESEVTALKAELELYKQKEVERKRGRAAIMRRYVANNPQKIKEIKRKSYYKRKQERLEAEAAP